MAKNVEFQPIEVFGTPDAVCLTVKSVVSPEYAPLKGKIGKLHPFDLMEAHDATPVTKEERDWMSAHIKQFLTDFGYQKFKFASLDTFIKNIKTQFGLTDIRELTADQLVYINNALLQIVYVDIDTHTDANAE